MQTAALRTSAAAAAAAVHEQEWVR